MQRDIPIGLGAGLAAAILILELMSGSGLGFVIALFAALPITLATLGWNSRAGLIAAGTSMIALGLVATGFSAGDAFGTTPLRFALEFGVSRALPAWGLAHLAIAGFPDDEAAKGPVPLGVLAVASAILATAGSLFAIFSLGSSYSEAISNLEQELLAAYRAMMSIPDGQPIPVDRGFDPQTFFHTVSRLALPLSALTATIFDLCGLWLAGRIARISGRLPRPWPDVAAALRLPRWSLALGAAACLVSLLPDLYGYAGQLLVAGLLGAFLLQGFAVVHYLSRGNALRPMMLAGVYAFSLFPATIAIAWSLLIMLGVADAIFDLRGRSNGQPKTPNVPKTFN